MIEPIEGSDGSTLDTANRGDARNSGQAIDENRATSTLALRGAAIFNTLKTRISTERVKKSSFWVTRENDSVDFKSNAALLVRRHGRRLAKRRTATAGSRCVRVRDVEPCTIQSVGVVKR